MSSTPDIIPNTMRLSWYDKRIPCWSPVALVNLFKTCYNELNADAILSQIQWDKTIDWLVANIIYYAKKEMLDFSKWDR